MTTVTTTTNGRPFHLLNSAVVPLTRELAARFAAMEASPTERSLSPSRVAFLKDKIDEGLGINFQWATAKLGERTLRMNGQHSSKMLAGLNGSFPEDLKVHLDEYEVENSDGLALLFQQFDYRKGARSTKDVAGAWQKINPALDGVGRDTAKLGLEGIVWYERVPGGLGKDAPRGEDQYRWFGREKLHPFLIWFGGLYDINTPQFKRQQIVAAMYATWLANTEEAKGFWLHVKRGGTDTEGSPMTVLAEWLLQLKKDERDPNKRHKGLKDEYYYHGCLHAWNNFREEKPLTTIKPTIERAPIG